MTNKTDSIPSNELLVRETAAALAHRACCGTEHDTANGKLHGYCVVCGVPWPCDTAKYYLRLAPETVTELDALRAENANLRANYMRLVGGHAPETNDCHIRPHDFCSAGTCKVCMDAARYRFIRQSESVLAPEHEKEFAEMWADIYQKNTSEFMDRRIDQAMRALGDPREGVGVTLKANEHYCIDCNEAHDPRT